jgi:adenylate cyclase
MNLFPQNHLYLLWFELQEIDENDLQLLERVGQQLGVALDKHQILQNEKTKTALFQKFVPTYAKSEMFGLTEANVGWQVKDTVAMFVDVKNYTAVTALLPPNAVAKLVNEFYSLTSACARKHGGYVDKFIGDAALVTWGYLDPLGANSDKAVQCALDIMAGLDDLNSRLREFMIPEIGVTIGMDRGESVCGLFGSDERMEFTGIDFFLYERDQ